MCPDWLLTRATLGLMVCGTRQAFSALRTASNAEILAICVPDSLPTVFVMATGAACSPVPGGVNCGSAHSRAAREEMHPLA